MNHDCVDDMLAFFLQRHHVVDQQPLNGRHLEMGANDKPGQIAGSISGRRDAHSALLAAVSADQYLQEIPPEQKTHLVPTATIIVVKN